MSSIFDIDFKDYLLYNSESQYNCDEYGCSQEDICRCSTIKKTTILETLNLKEIVKKIYGHYFVNKKTIKRNNQINSILFGSTDDIDIYTIDRILRINKIWKSSTWFVNIVDGYYGEEIEGIRFNEVISNKIESQLNQAFDLIDLNKRIEYLLELEYGKVLPELKDKKFQLAVVNHSDIIFGSQSQREKVSKKNLEYYSDKNYDLIRGVVVKSDNKWRLIDGYHRCFATNNKLVKVLIAG